MTMPLTITVTMTTIVTANHSHGPNRYGVREENTQNLQYVEGLKDLE